MWSLIKTILWVLPPLFVVATVALFFWFKRDVVERERSLSHEIAELRAAPVETYDFGLDSFDQAIDLLRESGPAKAADALRAMLRAHPESARAGDAMHLLGQLNLDKIFSNSPPEPATRISVRPGDSLNRIASRENTTLHYLMRANSITRPESLQPGQQLQVLPLHFRLIIDFSGLRAILMDESAFVASFPIESIRRPPGAALPFSGSVTGKFAVRSGDRVLLTSPEYHHAEKWIEIGRDWAIRSSPTDDEPTTGFGIFLSPADADDLMVLLRIGNHVEIRP